MHLFPGLVLAERYRLTRPLGVGGMGEVWAAIHVTTGRPVAVKRLLRSIDGRPEHQARARFVLEAQAACAVLHPNVVEVLDFIERGDDPPVIVMELLEGETLAARITREHTLDLEQTARILLPVFSAVGTAHARGIVHRDLKPANIFLSGGDAKIKVLDFGIAKWFSRRGALPELRTQTGSTLGTPSYMAPEQALGERVLDHRVDVWSLGVIAYECLSGARPIEGENAAQLMVSLLSTGIMPIDRVVAGLPAEIADVIGRSLSRAPHQRPGDLREVLAVWQGHTTVTVPRFGAPKMTADPDEALADDSGHTSTPPVSRPVVDRGGTVELSNAYGEPTGRRARAAGVSRSGLRRPALRWLSVASLVALAGVLTARALATGAHGEAHAALAKAPERTPPSGPPDSLAEEPHTLPSSTTVPPAESGGAPRPEPGSKTVLSVAGAGPAWVKSATHVDAKSTKTKHAEGVAPPSGRTKGAPCERSRECESGLCVAFECD